MAIRERLRWAVACAVAGVGAAQAGMLEPPKPEIFARVEDQERARLLDKPCTQADVGHGCYLYNGVTVRKAPCAHDIDAGTIGFLPLDQCYRMESPRRFRGVWIDAFEGQAFIPDGTTPPEWPRTDSRSADWRARAEKAQAASIWLDVERVNLGHDFRNGGRRMSIDFIGRKTMFPGSYGHMGMSGNEIIVDRVISLKKIE